MQTWQIVLLIVLVVALIVAIVLYFLGRRLEKQQDANEAKLEVGKQTVSMLVIDKKRMKLKDAGLPQIVVDQTPKYMRGAKVPVVKAKVGPKVMSLICDEKVYDLIPVKKEVKAVMNGIYIIDVKGARGGLEQKPEKKGFLARLREKASKAQEELAKENAKEKSKKEKKKI